MPSSTLWVRADVMNVDGAAEECVSDVMGLRDEGGAYPLWPSCDRRGHGQRTRTELHVDGLEATCIGGSEWKMVLV